MGAWKVTNPATGKSYILRGEAPPTEEDIDEVLKAQEPAKPDTQMAGTWSNTIAQIPAGANDVIAGTIGAPVDAANWLLHNNPLDVLVNGAGHLAGRKDDILPSMLPPAPKKPFMGSEFIKQNLMGAIDANPEDVPAETPGNRILRNVARGATAGAIPVGGMSVFSGARAGAIGGLGGGVGEEIVPEPYKPIANLLGSLTSLGAASAAAAAPRALGNKFLGAMPQSATRLSELQSENIPVSAGLVTGNKSLGTLETALSKAPGGSGIFEKHTDDIQNALRTRSAELADKFGPVATPEVAGKAIKSGLTGASTRFRTVKNRLYDDALLPVINTNLKGRNLPNLENLAQEFLAQKDAAPESSLRTAGFASDKANAILRDMAAGKATLKTLRDIRTDIGREIDDPILAGVSGAQQPYFKRLYRALSDDMNSIADKSDPTGTVRKKLSLADRYTRSNSTRLEFLDDFLGKKMDGEVYNAAMSSGTAERGGGQLLNKIRRSIRPEEWDTVAGTVLGRMGRAKAGQQEASSIASEGAEFSPATFMTNWSSLRPEAKQALFGGTRYKNLVPQLDRFVRVTGNLRDYGKLGGGSQTFERGAHYALPAMMATAAAEGAMRSGPIGMVTDPLAVFMAGYVAPRQAAKLMTNPKFVNWLVKRSAAKTPAAISMANKMLSGVMSSQAASILDDDKEPE